MTPANRKSLFLVGAVLFALGVTLINGFGAGLLWVGIGALLVAMLAPSWLN